MTRTLILVVVLGSLIAPFASAATTVPAADIVRIDPSTRWGTWDGWGVSLAWWAKIFGDRDDLADAIFTLRDVKLPDQTLPGLGLNIVRYNLGACGNVPVEDRRMVSSKIIQPFRQMEGFWLDGKNQDPQSNSWDWNVDANQRAMLLKARDRGVNQFELFSNSPMWWMCTNDNPSGAPKATDDNLPQAHYHDFATYLATVAAQAKSQWGIQFTTVEPFNEPSSHFWWANCKQEGCHFSPAAQSAILPLLRAALDQRGLNAIGIAVSDENQYDAALTTWNAYTPDARKLISRINVHGYQGSHGNRAGLFDAVKDKKLWNSEYGEIKSEGLVLARNLNMDFRTLHPAAWIYWQALDSGGWGLISADLSKKTISPAETRYFVLAQYSRHIRPGMVILDTGDMDTVAAYDAKLNKLVIVAANHLSTARDVVFDLSEFTTADGPVACYLTEPKATARYARQSALQPIKKRVEVRLPAMSVETFEVHAIAP